MNFEEPNVSAVADITPVLSPGAVAWRALREAARALEAAAAAMLGQPAGSPIAPGFAGDELSTVVNTVNQFLLAKARAGRSDRYLRQLRVSLTSFTMGRALRPINSIQPGEIEKWLDDAEWSARTQRGYLSDVRTLFNFALKRGFTARNPAAAVELPVLDDLEPPRIHSPAEVARVLEVAREKNPDVCRLLAVRYFAGVRTAEAQRLREENILLDRGMIEVPAKKSKTRRRRLITIQPNLRAWLELGGELRAMSDYGTIRPVIRASKVGWHHNVTRHSFVSYHVAHFQNAGKTALEAGHTEQMLFSNYRELVTPAAAAEFWAIVPKP